MLERTDVKLQKLWFWPLKNKENINKVLKDNILTMYTSIKCKIWLVFEII